MQRTSFTMLNIVWHVIKTKAASSCSCWLFGQLQQEQPFDSHLFFSSSKWEFSFLHLEYFFSWTQWRDEPQLREICCSWTWFLLLWKVVFNFILILYQGNRKGVVCCRRVTFGLDSVWVSNDSAAHTDGELFSVAFTRDDSAVLLLPVKHISC